MSTTTSRNWESWLATASGPASATEEQERDRTEARIRQAIREAPDLPGGVRVYAKGSYANNTNVRRDADVDVAVEWAETAYVHTWGETEGMTPGQLGYNLVPFQITPAEFRLRVERALLTAFGSRLVDTASDKHIGVPAGAGTLDVDVVPCFELHRYDGPGWYVQGHRIFPTGGGLVDNYPQQNYDNGVAKNAATGRRYKEIVRCMKRLVGELHDEGVIRRDYPGYLIESLIFNVPNDRFGHTRRYDDIVAVLRFLWEGLNNPDAYLSWVEPSRLLTLFRDRPQRIPESAQVVVGRAWEKLGFA